MYLPNHFREDRLDRLHDAIRQSRLALLVSVGPKGLIATHLPMLLDPTPAPYGRLFGHMSRGNPHWREVDQAAEALAIFQGPEAYISPAWYPTKQEAGKVVPTWNYVAIHAYGRPEIFEDPVRLKQLVSRLTQHHESRRKTPWTVDDAPADYIAGQLKGIVGFEMPIARIEGKWKLSQNRTPQDQAGAIRGLNEEGGQAELAVAALMSEKGT